jgi:hypothetical protein
MATLYWDAFAAGTMDLATLQQRELSVVQFRLGVAGGTIYWTDDGTTSGTSLFKNVGSPILTPWVEVMVMQGDGGFSPTLLSGPVFTTEVGAVAPKQWMWRTSYDTTGTGFWVTRVYRGGPDNEGYGLTGAQGELTGVAYAMGRGA